MISESKSAATTNELSNFSRKCNFGSLQVSQTQQSSKIRVEQASIFLNKLENDIVKSEPAEVEISCKEFFQRYQPKQVEEEDINKRIMYRNMMEKLADTNFEDHHIDVLPVIGKYYFCGQMMSYYKQSNLHYENFFIVESFLYSFERCSFTRCYITSFFVIPIIRIQSEYPIIRVPILEHCQKKLFLTPKVKFST